MAFSTYGYSTLVTLFKIYFMLKLFEKGDFKRISFWKPQSSSSQVLFDPKIFIPTLEVSDCTIGSIKWPRKWRPLKLGICANSDRNGSLVFMCKIWRNFPMLMVLRLPSLTFAKKFFTCFWRGCGIIGFGWTREQGTSSAKQFFLLNGRGEYIQTTFS